MALCSFGKGARFSEGAVRFRGTPPGFPRLRRCCFPKPNVGTRRGLAHLRLHELPVQPSEFTVSVGMAELIIRFGCCTYRDVDVAGGIYCNTVWAGESGLTGCPPSPEKAGSFQLLLPAIEKISLLSFVSFEIAIAELGYEQIPIGVGDQTPWTLPWIVDVQTRRP